MPLSYALLSPLELLQRQEQEQRNLLETILFALRRRSVPVGGSRVPTGTVAE